MPTNLTETPNTYPATVAAPVAGEPRTAASVRAPLTDLVNRTGFLKAKTDSQALDIADLRDQLAGSLLTFGTSRITNLSGFVGNPSASQRLFFAYPNSYSVPSSTTMLLRSSLGNSWYYTTTGGALWVNQAGSGLTVTDMLGGTLSGTGYVVAVGTSTTVRKSTDLGTNWSGAGTTPAAVTRLGHVGETWVAFPDSVAGSDIYYSTNLSTWSNATIGAGWAAVPLLRIEDSGAGSAILLPVSWNGGSFDLQKVRFSTNGLAWTPSNIIPGLFGAGVVTVGGAAYSTKLGLWVLTATNGLNWSSADGGATWVSGNTPAFGLGRVVERNGVFVALVPAGGLAYSTNGFSWQYLPDFSELGALPAAWQDIIVCDSRIIVGTYLASGELEYRFSGRQLLT